MAKSATGTADFNSGFTTLKAVTVTGGADAATVNIREGSVSGTIKFVVKAAINTTTHLYFGEDGVESASGAWFVDLSAGTTPQMSVTGA